MTDCTLSRDGQFLAYTSITPVVNMASTVAGDDKQYSFDLSDGNIDRFGVIINVKY